MKKYRYNIEHIYENKYIIFIMVMKKYVYNFLI